MGINRMMSIYNKRIDKKMDAILDKRLMMDLFGFIVFALTCMVAPKEWFSVWIVIAVWITGILSNIADSYMTTSIMKLCREEGLKMDGRIELAEFSNAPVMVTMFGVLVILSLKMGLGAYISSFWTVGLLVFFISREIVFRHEMHKALR